MRKNLGNCEALAILVFRLHQVIGVDVRDAVAAIVLIQSIERVDLWQPRVCDRRDLLVRPHSVLGCLQALFVALLCLKLLHNKLKLLNLH